MKRYSVILIYFLFIASVVQAQDRSEWFEFYLPWDDSTESVTNMSAYLDAPAGKHGFLKVTPDGHFRFENAEENIRFTGGVNVAISNFPTHDQAEIIAARIAKFGLNVVRIHLIDVEGAYGLFDNSTENTIDISSAKLDRMYYFTKCLKERGIYYNFCIHSGRIYKVADGIPAPVENNQAKYITLFNPEIIALEKQYACKTLTGINPYTNLSYIDDPAMISIELTNENQMYNGWFGWQSDFLFEDNPEGIGSYYSRQLDTLFNIWLAEKYISETTLESAWSGALGVGEELIKNSSFEDGLTNWTTWISGGGAVSTMAVDSENPAAGSGSLKIHVTQPGTETWHIQLKTNNFNVERDKSYKIEFYSRSSKSGEAAFQIMENVTWKWVANPAYPVDTVWKKFEYFFSCTFDSDALVLQFDYGLQPGDFWLDSVSVKEYGGVGLEEQELWTDNSIKRVKYAEMGKYSQRRVADNANFYFDLEGDYIEEMSSYLKNDLGLKVPVTFTNNYYGLASIYSQSRADYMDTHYYWDHPNYPNGYSNTDFTLHNKSMVKNPKGSTINKMLLCKVKNKPLVLSEYNHPYPYIYQAEAPSLLYAYGSYMDLDGIIWHAYYDYMNRFSQRHQDMFFDIAMHPVMMTHQMLSIPYRLGYINPAENVVYAHYNHQSIFDNTKGFQDEDVLNIDGVDYGSSFLVDGFAHASFDSDSGYIEGEFTKPTGIIRSDREELSWDGEQGIFTVNNPYWQGATGFLKGKTIQLDHVSFSGISTTENLGFASVHLISLDSLPVNESKKLVLLTGARLENEGFLWNGTQTSPVSVGGTRALCEPVSGVLKLNFTSRDSLYLFRLDERGQRSEVIFEADTAGQWEIPFGNNTLWYELLNDSAVAVAVIPIDTVVTDTTIIDSNALQLDDIKINCYPNPFTDQAVFEFDIRGATSGKLLIYDSKGGQFRSREVVTENGQKSQLIMDLSDLSAGIYFYALQTNKGFSSIKKLIKMGI